MKSYKDGDFFNCWYTDGYRNSQPNTDLNHCFEGLVRVVISDDGTIKFWDTFWGLSPRCDCGKWFNLSDVGVTIGLSYIANIHELEPGKASDSKYYDPSDLVELHDQHRCHRSCIYHYRKVGAVRSKDRMLASINIQISKIESDIEYAARQRDNLLTTQRHIQDGIDLNTVYI